MKKLYLLILLICALLIASPSNGAAYDVVADLNGDAIGILDLNIDGALYNVEFDFGFYNDIFGEGSSSGFFWDLTGAEIAADAINVALEGSGGPSQGFVDFDTIADGIETTTNFFIPYEFTSATASIVRGVKGDLRFQEDWRILSSSSGESAGGGSGAMYAKFEAVPIPGAVWLLGSLLLGFLGLKRARKQSRV
jgi:hypothetical protein